MQTWIMIIWIVTGLFLLKQGAGWFVEGSAALARRLRMGELAIGLTIVAFGTSAPELVVNSFASWKGNHEIVLGNIIGSNSFNLFIILSITGLIVPMRIQSSTAWKEIPISFIAIVVLFAVANDTFLYNREVSVITRIDGMVLLGCFLLFLLYVVSQLKQERVNHGEPGETQREMPLGRLVLLMVGGLAGLIIGGKLLLDHSVKLAIQLGMSERMIGLTIVAAGTSLPELATSVVAALRRNNDIAVGNIIGSNIFNLFFILGLSAVIRPLPYITGFNIDLGVLASGTLILFLAMYTGRKLQIDRWEAFVLLALYTGYFILFLI